MLTALLSLLGTSGFGAIIGWLGGAVNRYFDMKTKDKDLDAKKVDQAHELALKDKDLEYMREEYAQRAQLAQAEGEIELQKAGYAALETSYSNDKAAYGGGFVDSVRGLLRPLITLAFFGFAVAVFVAVLQIVWEQRITFTRDEVFELFKYCVYWVLFQAAVCIGWWFALRPSTPARLK